MAKFSHVWFDFAGTLYRETPKFHELHDQFRFRTYAELKGMSDLVQAKHEFLELYTRYGSNSAVFRALGQSTDYWMKALDNMDFTSALQPDAEVTDTLRKLASIIPVSLFTNFPHYRIQQLLNHLKIPSALFTCILSGDDVEERKPAPDGFRSMVVLSKTKPEEILYIGDRVDVDIVPAKQLGIRTALLYGESPEADYCIANFKDIPVLL